MRRAGGISEWVYNPKQVFHKQGNLKMLKEQKTTVRRGGALPVLLCAAMFALAGGGAQAAECENPEALRFSIIPTEETTQELELYRPLIERLEARTGKQVEFYLPTSYASVVEAMLGGWVDIAVHGPNSYVLAAEKDPTIEVFATYAKRAGHLQEEGPGYQAVLVSRKGTKFDTVESLRGAVLGLTDPASTSGNLLPRVSFVNVIGEDLDSYFSRIVYTGGHDKSALAVNDGKVDTAFVASHRFDNVVDRGLIKLADFNVLWRSPFIPGDPFTYRGKLCGDLKKKIRDTFLTLHEDADARVFLDNLKTGRFVPMTSADYDIVRDLRRAKEEAKKKS